MFTDIRTDFVAFASQEFQSDSTVIKLLKEASPSTLIQLFTSELSKLVAACTTKPDLVKLIFQIVQIPATFPQRLSFYTISEIITDGREMEPLYLTQKSIVLVLAEKLWKSQDVAVLKKIGCLLKSLDRFLATLR